MTSTPAGWLPGVVAGPSVAATRSNTPPLIALGFMLAQMYYMARKRYVSNPQHTEIQSIAKTRHLRSFFGITPVRGLGNLGG